MKIIENQYIAIVIVCLATLSHSIAHAETYYFHNDHLGTPQVVSDSTQQVVWEGAYLPFGEVNERVRVVTQNLRFPGQYFDSETGLHYNYFRDYDPSLGRYFQSDPIGLAAGLSTYSYVHSNPIADVDRFGLEAYSGQLPPENIPGGPWEPQTDGRPGSFHGPKQDKGPRTQCQYVPDASNGGPAGATESYWKTQSPGDKGWQRYDLAGTPITAEQAHPGNKKNNSKLKGLLKFLPGLAPALEMTAPSTTRVPPGTDISPYM